MSAAIPPPPPPPPPPLSPPLVRVRQLEKRFTVARRRTGLLGILRGLVARDHRVVRAVDGVSFDIAAGEIVGYLGPNGAGKSTTLKMLTGLLVPSAGEVMVDGFAPARDRRRYVARIGAVFGQRTTLWWDLPVIESLELLRHIYRVPPERFAANLDELAATLDLAPFLDTPVRSLSLGQRMRADLAAAMLHDPKILFLDEPTIGLDVVAKERIRAFILDMNRSRGTTVVLTTHDLSDVEKLCERVMIIDRGTLLFDGPLRTLRDRFGGERRLVVDFEDEHADVSVDGAAVLEHIGRRATYAFARDSISAAALIGRVAARYRIRDLEVSEPEIEATVRRIYEERLLEGGDDVEGEGGGEGGSEGGSEGDGGRNPVGDGDRERDGTDEGDSESVR